MIAIMRKMATLSIDDVRRGFENFASPSAKGLLESLGRTRQEQVDALAAMLRNSSDEDIAEMGQIFGEAMVKLAEEQRDAGAGPINGRTERPRGRRELTAAEWRRERRLRS